MRYLPVFLDLAGRAALVLGDGSTAERKAAALARAGAVLRRAARFEPGLLDGVAVAIGADAPEDDLVALYAAASARGIPVNVVDRPALCSFITPALIDRDPVTIAVGTGGAAPVLARLVRARIEALLPPDLGRLATLADGFRDEIRRRFPDLGRRRRLLERLFAGRVSALALAGEDDAARAAVADEIEAAAADMRAAGIVHLIGAGPGAGDLITLRAQRLLGEADVVVHDRHASAEVLDMARRDAERLAIGTSGGETDALLIGLARAGKVVVRLTFGAPAISAGLAASGVAVRIVPGVAASG